MGVGEETGKEGRGPPGVSNPVTVGGGPSRCSGALRKRRGPRSVLKAELLDLDVEVGSQGRLDKVALEIVWTGGELRLGSIPYGTTSAQGSASASWELSPRRSDRVLLKAMGSER